MEKDDELKGNGNSYTTEFRQYDPRIGRWLSLDPLMAKYPDQSPYASFNDNPIYFADPTGLEGDPPVKTIKNKEGQVVTPNGDGADFAKDWYSIVAGNLVMTNGTDYQVWDAESGLYVNGRAPKESSGSTSLDKLSYDQYQIGDTYEQRLKDPYGINTSNGIFGDSQTLQYVGELNWLVIDEFDGVKNAEYVSWVFPMGGGGGFSKGTARLLKWLGRFNTGRKLINAGIKLCFVEGTLVSTENGLKKIEEIEIGDKVWSFNEETCLTELKEVVTLFRNISDQLIEISIEKEKIICTPDHPFYLNGSWTEAKYLKTNDTLKSKNGSLGKIILIKKLQKEVKVYNFEVKGNHNYYVSELQVLVHNNNCFGFNIIKAVNSNMPHAIERGLQSDRAVFKTVDEATTALNAIKDHINQYKAFPAGSIKDPSYLDRVLVPVGNNGMASYQIAKNGSAKLKTVLVAK